MSSNIKPCQAQPAATSKIEQPKKTKPDWKAKLTRNTAIAVCALLTVVGVQQSAASPDGTFLKAVQGAIESEWDQNVGRLTYVSGMLSDSVQVFSRSSRDLSDLIRPVQAQAVQAWSEETPYLLYQNAGNVYAAASGEVTAIAHDDNSYYIIRLMHDNGLESLYYGLKSCAVQEGDPVTSDTLLGLAAPEFAFAVQRGGQSLDCSAQLGERPQ